MNTYTESRFFFYKTTITFTSYDTICYERKSPLGYSYEQIPLINFAPEAKVITKRLSSKAKWLLRLEAVIITLFFVAYFNVDDFRDVISLPSSAVFFGLLAIGSLIYCYVETRTFLSFCDFNLEKIYLRLIHDQNNPKQTELAAHFDLAVRNARVNHDQRNLIRLQNGIDSLEKQQVISTTFGDILHARVGQLTGKII